MSVQGLPGWKAFTTSVASILLGMAFHVSCQLFPARELFVANSTCFFATVFFMIGFVFHASKLLLAFMTFIFLESHVYILSYSLPFFFPVLQKIIIFQSFYVKESKSMFSAQVLYCNAGLWGLSLAALCTSKL